MDDFREATPQAFCYVCLTALAAVIVFLWSKPFALGILWIACVAGGVFLYGRQRPRSLGLSLRNVAGGAVYAIVLWAVAWGVMAGSALVEREPVQWPASKAFIVPVLMQLFFYALAEEIIFRGFILAQLYRKLRRAFTGRVWALVTAVILSQLFFALWHIPNRLYTHTPAVAILHSLAAVFAAGVLYSLIYLRTANLTTCLVAHAFSNVPGIYGGPIEPWAQFAMLGLALVLADAYARVESKRLGVKSIAL